MVAFKKLLLEILIFFICQQHYWYTMALRENADMKKNIATESCGWTASFSSSDSIERITSLINHLPESTFFSIFAFSLPLPQTRLRASHLFKCNKGLLTYDLAASSKHTLAAFDTYLTITYSWIKFLYKRKKRTIKF